MFSAKQQKSAEKLVPELYLKQVLSGPYETIENHNIFRVTDSLVLQQISKSIDVDCCKNIDDFKAKLERGRPNLLVAAGLINRTLLSQIVATSSQAKNIILGDF